MVPEEPIKEEEEVEDEPIHFDYDPTARSCAWCYAVLGSEEAVYPSFRNADDIEPPLESISLDYDNPSSTDNTDPTSVAADVTTCPHCPRIYCSPSCCTVDWKTHHFWCGKAGEKGIDFDVCEIQGKGLGLVTKRAFQRGEKILAERPVLTTRNLPCAHNNDAPANAQESGEVSACESNTTVFPASPSNGKSSKSLNHSSHENQEEVNTNIRTAAMALTPLGGSLGEKVNANGVSVGRTKEETAAGLFLTFSRVNHDCVGNSDHYFDHQHGVEVLVANDAIAVGEEITFPYTRTGKDRLSDLLWRGFTCACRACQSPEWGSKLNQLTELEQMVAELGGKNDDTERDEAVQSALAMLELYDEIHVSDRDYARTHYDLFQILVTQETSLDQAHQHIAKAYEHALCFCGYEDHETVEQFLHYRNHPESHGNYRVIDYSS